MKVEAVELRRISLPLVAPFRPRSAPSQPRRRCSSGPAPTEGKGWGECVAMASPRYSSEYVDGAADVLRRFLCRGCSPRRR